MSGAATDDLECRELVALLTDLLDGALDPYAAARVRAHLATCDGCAEALAQWRTTIDLTGRLRTVEPIDPAVRASLLSAWRRRCDG